MRDNENNRDNSGNFAGSTGSDSTSATQRHKLSWDSNGILAGFWLHMTPAIASALARNLPHALGWALLVAASLYLLSLVLSFAFALRVVLPRLDVSQPDSCVFFAHIANQYKNNYEKIAKNLPSTLG